MDYIYCLVQWSNCYAGEFCLSLFCDIVSDSDKGIKLRCEIESTSSMENPAFSAG
jgi:hypothetical protein